MLTPEERQERDPTAIQREILELEKQMQDEAPALEEANRIMLENKALVDVGKMRMKIIKDRISGLQSVLKSLQVR